MTEIQTKFKAWAEKFLRLPGEGSDPTMSVIYLSCVVNEAIDDQWPPAVTEVFNYKLVDKRAEYAGLKLTNSAKVLICALADSPGEAVMYITALAYDQKLLKYPQLNLKRLLEIYPEGYPSQDKLRKIWEEQKIGGANLLDLPPSELMPAEESSK
jgi:hypothetical protein